MINLNELTSHHPAFHNIVASHLPHYFAGGPQASNHLGNDFRHARKLQTIRETTFAMRGNSKPFGKRLSPSAEMPNHSGNDFRRVAEALNASIMALNKNESPLPF